MKTFALSLRMLNRDWRSGELRVLVVALVIAVASVTTVSFFADRVQRSLSDQANQLLGADLVLTSDRPIQRNFEERAIQLGLRVTRALRFPSMVLHAGTGQLTEIKAVAAGYPLRGELRATAQGGPSEIGTRPERGSVWVDPRLATRLGFEVGDRIALGNTSFRIAAVIVEEPDFSIGLFNIAPRLLMNLSDVPATGLIQTGSRITYQLLFAGDPEAVADFRAWAQSHLALGERLEGVQDARPEIRAVLERSKKYLGLAALMSVVLAAVAVALAAQRFVNRHLDGCAMMRCLGARQAVMLRLYLYHFLLLGATASLGGCILGLLGQEFLVRWLSGLATRQLPLPNMWPAAYGFACGILLLLGFAVPPLVRLTEVPTLRVLRRELGAPKAAGATGYILGFLIIAAMLLWQANDLKLGMYVLSGLIGGVTLFTCIALALMKLLQRLRSGVGVAWRFGLASLHRRASGGVLQVVSLSAGIMALLLLTLVRGDLLQSWRSSLPPGAPNRFLVNIQKDQLQALQGFFAAHGMGQLPIFPMVRGRLTAINGKRVSPADYSEPRAKRLVEREFNLSWARELQNDNQIVAGRWWREQDSGKAEFSVEKGLAETLGIRLGDRLTYDIAGNVLSGRVASLRKVDWDSFRVNFFVIAPPGVLENYPVSYISSFYLPGDRYQVINDLVKAFPNFLVIDVAEIMSQVQKIMDKVVLAVEFVFMFSLVAGLTVLYAGVVAAQDERMLEAAVLRTLGGSTAQIMRAQLSEFAAIGALAGLLAAAGASALGYVLASRVLNVAYVFNPWLWIMGLAGGAAGVTIACLPQLRGILIHPPLQTLRNLG
ncbi:MAG TPA: ABC transporter permease [Burkholderiales bacterium]|nr:ABC transporter permease [Burkholderiales bacterium]